MYIAIAAGMLAAAAFIILSAKDLIKYLIKSKRIKHGETTDGEQLSHKKIITRNLILLPIGIAVIVVLYFLL